MTLQALGQVATSVGLSAALVLFFVWQAWKREERTATDLRTREAAIDAREIRVLSEAQRREDTIIVRVQELESFNRNTLMGMAEKSAIALNNVTVAMQDNTAQAKASIAAIQKLDDDLKTHHKVMIELADKIVPQGKPHT